jgi:RimJ/RimL family protein N-acetyltransferase
MPNPNIPEGGPMSVLETERLTLREFVAGDAPFILALLNDPAWLHYIGDKNIRTLDDARAYIERVPAAMVARHGFGLYAVSLKNDGTPVGMCGLIKRDTLDDVDIGFAFLPQYCGAGYAREAAEAVLDDGRERLGMTRVVAITMPENRRSVRLLEQLGFLFERAVPSETGAVELNLFAKAL